MKTVEAGRQLVEHDDQWPHVGHSQMSFPAVPFRQVEKEETWGHGNEHRKRNGKRKQIAQQVAADSPQSISAITGYQMPAINLLRNNIPMKDSHIWVYFADLDAIGRH